MGNSIGCATVIGGVESLSRKVIHFFGAFNHIQKKILAFFR